MAMSGDTLGSAIASAVDSLDLTTNPAPTTEQMWQIIGNIIIDHIKSNADISVSTTHATGTIAVTGTAVAQVNPSPVTSSTGSGTIS